jgi:NAD(P)-dependent dehydrogenase (short-subunit alcohol dehydrogenase family)
MLRETKGGLNEKAYVITGPTSGIGKKTALELAKHGTVILVGRNRQKLDEVRKSIEGKGRKAVSVVCDMSDLVSIKRAAGEIAALGLPIAAVLNNAGIRTQQPSKSPQGWDLTFATNYLGPVALTEELMPHLSDGTTIAYIVSAIEDPERKPVKVLGMHGGRYISAEASARGEWKDGSSKEYGADAYATSKQCLLATALVFARETSRLRFIAIEPGITPGTGLGGGAMIVHSMLGYVITLFPPFAEFRSTPKRSARVIAKILADESGETGAYYNEKGRPMLGSTLVRDPEFQDRVVAETRAFLAVNQPE